MMLWKSMDGFVTHCRANSTYRTLCMHTRPRSAAFIPDRSLSQPLALPSLSPNRQSRHALAPTRLDSDRMSRCSCTAAGHAWVGVILVPWVHHDHLEPCRVPNFDIGISRYRSHKLRYRSSENWLRCTILNFDIEVFRYRRPKILKNFDVDIVCYIDSCSQKKRRRVECSVQTCLDGSEYLFCMQNLTPTQHVLCEITLYFAMIFTLSQRIYQAQSKQYIGNFSIIFYFRLHSCSPV